MDLEVVFPKYISSSNGGSCLIRRGLPKYNEFDGNCYAKYYRPCGEWSCVIYYKKYTYYMNFIGAMPTAAIGDPFKNAKVVEVDVSTPQEFLKDNDYCISEATAQMFKEAWEDIPDEIKDHQEIFEERDDNGENPTWGHKEYYKTLNYKYNDFE